MAGFFDESPTVLSCITSCFFCSWLIWLLLREPFHPSFVNRDFVVFQTRVGEGCESAAKQKTFLNTANKLHPVLFFDLYFSTEWYGLSPIFLCERCVSAVFTFETLQSNCIKYLHRIYGSGAVTSLKGWQCNLWPGSTLVKWWNFWGPSRAF